MNRRIDRTQISTGTASQMEKDNKKYWSGRDVKEKRQT